MKLYSEKTNISSKQKKTVTITELFSQHPACILHVFRQIVFKSGGKQLRKISIEGKFNTEEDSIRKRFIRNK